VFQRIFLSALVAGILAGLLLTALQAVTTTPLILAAETYEQAPPAHQHAAGTVAQEHEAAEWTPADGLERTFYTGLANALTGVAFALLLLAAFALSGRAVDGRRGVVWGLAGYAVFALAPGLGLPPELPGSMAADLGARQLWWLGTAGATGLGLWLLVFPRALWCKGLGILALALPHLIGAPHPEAYGGPVPPEMAGHFAAASLATMAVFWAALGWLAGTLFARGADRERAADLAHRTA